jgi:FolB domain-containing protein
MDKLFVKDLLVRGIIGINEWERDKPQDIIINMVIFTDLARAGESDDINDSVNYRTLAKRAQSITETARRLTVEALAVDIAEMCLAEPGVQKVQVSVEKPGAVRFSRSVGVEIERSK